MSNKETVREKQESVAEGKETVTKKRGRPAGSKDSVPRKRNNAGAVAAYESGNSLANKIDVNDGDNAKFMALNMALFNMDDLDIYNTTVEKLEERLNQFFELYYSMDVKPTVAGMAMAVGLDRRLLINIINGNNIDGNGYKTTLRPELANRLKKAYKIMENFWEIYMNSGKVNPVTGIFLGKNNFGYQDKTEHVLTPNVKQDDDYDINEIKERYRLSDSNSQE